MIDRTMRYMVLVLLLAVAFTISIAGVDAVPAWIRGLSIRLQIEPDTMARILIGLSVCLAGMLATLRARGRALAVIGAAAIAFSGIADLAAWFSTENRAFILWPILQIVAGMVPLALWQASRKPTLEPMRHPALTGTLLALSILVAAIIAARAEPPPLTEAPTRIDQTSVARDEEGRLRVHNFTPEEWTGVGIEQTQIPEHLPQITELVGTEPSVVILYSPYCEVCHEIFDTLIAPDPPANVIAIEVPAAGDPSTRDMPEKEDVVCTDCTMLNFPRGPMWLITTPVVFTTENGIITCVSTSSDADPERCLAANKEAEAAKAASP